MNNRATNFFTGAVVAVLVLLSMILTAAVLVPDVPQDALIFGVLLGGSGVALLVAGAVWFIGHRRGSSTATVADKPIEQSSRPTWRMPPLTELPPARLSLASRVWMVVLRAYLLVASGLVLLRIISLATGHSA